MTRRDPLDAVAVKNLELIQEHDPEARSSRLSALVLASFGGACIVFAALALMPSSSEPRAVAADPLGDLMARRDDANVKPATLSASDVTFPSVLTDQARPTTAMAAVRRDGAEPQGSELGAGLFDGPPPATDRLPIVPLPAQDVLESSPAHVAPSDMLRTIAARVAREPENVTLAEPGGPGGHQLQASSFRTQDEADTFALVLRRRGHRAYVQEAQIPGRGLWFRVRIGPFRYKRSAEIYRQDFEAKERMVTFIVDPPKAKIEIALTDGDGAASNDDKD